MLHAGKAFKVLDSRGEDCEELGENIYPSLKNDRYNLHTFSNSTAKPCAMTRGCKFVSSE